MSEKRRDNKNRVLEKGESQRKDGMYCYKYNDLSGKSQFIYSWKLVQKDKTPKDKRDGLSLREKKQAILRDIADGIDSVGKKMTVSQLYKKFVRHRGTSRLKTEEGHERVMKMLEQDKLGACRIENVKISDTKDWVLRMNENGVAYTTINNDKRSLKAAFFTAIQDDCIRKNPFDFALNTVIEDDTEPKIPLTPTQQRDFLAFLQNDKTYLKNYDEFFILLKTGLRISELCGLTLTDIDLEGKTINIEHQLLKSKVVGYYIAPPKTKNSYRQIPMNDEVYEAFTRVLGSRKHEKPIVVLDKEGKRYSNFIFLNRDGLPSLAYNFQSTLGRIVEKYNKSHEEPLPKVTTPHTLRHTFCTNLANLGMNPKSLQYLMGHGNVSMTLNYYAHADFTSAREEFERLRV